METLSEIKHIHMLFRESVAEDFAVILTQNEFGRYAGYMYANHTWQDYFEQFHRGYIAGKCGNGRQKF